MDHLIQQRFFFFSFFSSFYSLHALIVFLFHTHVSSTFPFCFSLGSPIPSSIFVDLLDSLWRLERTWVLIWSRWQGPAFLCNNHPLAFVTTSSLVRSTILCHSIYYFISFFLVILCNQVDISRHYPTGSHSLPIQSR